MNRLFKKAIVILVLLTTFSTLSAWSILLEGYPTQGAFIDTLRSGLFAPKNEGFDFMYRWFHIKYSFYNQGLVYDINIFEDKPNLRYKLWLQPTPSDMVVLLPGLGTNYASTAIAAYAEIFYLKGYSVLSISNTFNWEFSEAASSVATPGFTPVDSKDIYFALSKIINHIENTYPGRVKDKKLVGYSHGALNTLFIAELESKIGENKIGFSKYLALNPPVDLYYGVRELDSFYMAAATWSPSKVNEVVAKVFQIAKKIVERTFDLKDRIDLTDEEASYFIGYMFHLSLSEIVFSVHKRINLGYLKAESSWFSRDDLYKEIDRVTFEEYVKYMLVKYYEEKLDIKMSIDDFNAKSSLSAIENTLKTNDKIRVIDTRNDFLETDEQRDWLSETLGDKLTRLSAGGHLGYLYEKQAQDLIMEKLTE